MTFNDLLQAIDSKVLLDFSGQASQAAYNPAGLWISRICCRELNRRNGEPLQDIAPLELQPEELEFALEWLDLTSESLTWAAVKSADNGLLKFATLVAHVHQVLAARVAAPLH